MCVCVLDIRDAQNCAANSFLFFFFVLHIHNHLFGIYRNYDISFLIVWFRDIFHFFHPFLWLVMAQSACRFLIRFFFSSVYCVTSGSGFVCLWINIWIKAHFHFSLYDGLFSAFAYSIWHCVRSPYCKHLWICVALNRVELTVQTHRDLMYVFRFSLSLFWVDTHTESEIHIYTKKTQPTNHRNK